MNRSAVLPVVGLHAAASIAAGALLAAPFTVPPRPSGAVHDGARAVRPVDAAAMERLAREVWTKGRVAIVVAVVPSLEGEAVEDVAIRIAKAWGIGGREDRGVLLFAAIEDRKARIETGYGVEGYLPDGLTGEILDEDVVPRFRKGDVSGGLRAGVERIAALSARELGFTIEGLRPPAGSRGVSLSGKAPIILGVLALILASRMILGGRAQGWSGNPLLWLLVGLTMGRRRRWRRRGPFGGSWGGGFGGGFGGGSLGGGGFGGFGGGSFGGGGASRGW